MVAKIDPDKIGDAQLTGAFNAGNPPDASKELDALIATADMATLQALVAQHKISPLTYTRRLENMVLTQQKELHLAHVRIEELGGELVATSEALAHEIEAREAAEAAKWIDALTGLPNRGAFDNALAGILAEPEDDKEDVTCIVYLDIDGLKQTNDCYGHPAGDRLLLAATALFQQRLRGEDEIFRVGGDEVTLLIRGKPETIRNRMLRMQEDLEKVRIRVEVAGEWKDIPAWGFSFGIHQIDKNHSIAENYNAADKEMYKDKKHRKAVQADLREERTAVMLADKAKQEVYTEGLQTAHQKVVANDVGIPAGNAPAPASSPAPAPKPPELF